MVSSKSIPCPVQAAGAWHRARRGLQVRGPCLQPSERESGLLKTFDRDSILFRPKNSCGCFRCQEISPIDIKKFLLVIRSDTLLSFFRRNNDDGDDDDVKKQVVGYF